MAEVFKNAYIVAAQIAADSTEMDDFADDIRDAVRLEAAKHVNDGNFERSIKVVKSRGPQITDRMVISDDPLGAIKEFGHAIYRDGVAVGYVPGLHSFGNALKKLPRIPAETDD